MRRPLQVTDVLTATPGIVQLLGTLDIITHSPAFISPWGPRLRKGHTWPDVTQGQVGECTRVCGLLSPVLCPSHRTEHLLGHLPHSDVCIALLGVSILSPPPVGFPERLSARGSAGSWTVCAFLLQVNNKVVHTEFFLREEPIKVSLVMESTLTRSVYFWHQDGLKNKDFFIIDFVKNCEAL